MARSNSRREVSIRAQFVLYGPPERWVEECERDFGRAPKRRSTEKWIDRKDVRLATPPEGWSPKK